MATKPVTVIVVLRNNASSRFEIGSLSGAMNTYRIPSITVAAVMRANPIETNSNGRLEFLR